MDFDAGDVAVFIDFVAAKRVDRSAGVTIELEGEGSCINADVIAVQGIVAAATTNIIIATKANDRVFIRCAGQSTVAPPVVALGPYDWSDSRGNTTVAAVDDHALDFDLILFDVAHINVDRIELERLTLTGRGIGIAVCGQEILKRCKLGLKIRVVIFVDS